MGISISSILNEVSGFVHAGLDCCSDSGGELVALQFVRTDDGRIEVKAMSADITRSDVEEGSGVKVTYGEKARCEAKEPCEIKSMKSMREDAVQSVAVFLRDMKVLTEETAAVRREVWKGVCRHER